MKKGLKNLLEIRDFSIRLLIEHKDLEGPDYPTVREGIFKVLKKHGYSKFWSVKAKEFLKGMIFTEKYPTDLYFSCTVVPEKKGFCIIGASLKKIKVEDKVYYVGTIKDKKLVLIIAPHFFWRYRSRNNLKTLDEAIFDFLISLLVKNPKEVKVPNFPGEIITQFKMGAGFGLKTTLGIQEKEVAFFKTFVSNDMLTQEQKDLFI